MCLEGLPQIQPVLDVDYAAESFQTLRRRSSVWMW